MYLQLTADRQEKITINRGQSRLIYSTASSGHQSCRQDESNLAKCSGTPNQENTAQELLDPVSVR